MILGLTNRCSTSNDFETDRKERTLVELKKYFDNAASGINVEQYLLMCEQLGDEPDPDKIPPDYDSFPSYVHTGMEIFNALTDTYTGGMQPVYSGKNLSALPVLFDLYLIDDKEDRMDIFDIVRFLDNRARKQAMDEAKKAAKKASK